MFFLANLESEEIVLGFDIVEDCKAGQVLDQVSIVVDRDLVDDCVLQ
jgi:hypothetical protein